MTRFLISIICAAVISCAAAFGESRAGVFGGTPPPAPSFAADWRRASVQPTLAEAASLNPEQTNWLVNALAVIGLLVGIGVGVQRLFGADRPQKREISGEIGQRPRWATHEELSVLRSEFTDLKEQFRRYSGHIELKIEESRDALLKAGEERIGRIDANTNHAMDRVHDRLNNLASEVGKLIGITGKKQP